MGNAVTDKDSQLSYLQNRLKMFIEVIDHLDPEHAELDDIDRLIQLLEDMEVKVEQFKKDQRDAE
ncbi:SE1561 family protein [Bacillus sp. DJP31]|uniref:SE1561 family protein n=1 Tax=Bacillus sp. DJP31 TaxID=3409789 RepID=UPI003BB4E8C8